MNEREFFVYNHEVRNFGERKRGHFGNSYIALSMVLRHQGIETTPRAVFEEVHGKKAAVKDALAPTFTHLAAVAQDLSANALFPLKATVWNKEKYRKLNEKSSKDITPFDVMDAYLLGRNAPCIIRVEEQPWLVTGVEPITRSYTIYNPRYNFTDLYKKVWFDRWWPQEDPHYPGSEYLMLTIEKDKKYY